MHSARTIARLGSTQWPFATPKSLKTRRGPSGGMGWLGVWNCIFRLWWFKISEPEVWWKSWAAANGGVTNGGLRGVWPPFLEIGRNRPFSPFFCLFRPFSEGAKSTWEIQKTEEKGLFPQISSDFLKPPSLKPLFAALQKSLFLWNFGDSPAKFRPLKHAIRNLEYGHSSHHQSIPPLVTRCWLKKISWWVTFCSPSPLSGWAQHLVFWVGVNNWK